MKMALLYHKAWGGFLLITLLLMNQVTVSSSAVAADELASYGEYRYRVINWCIVGQGEHLLYQWPLNQLKWFLLNYQKGEREFKDNLKSNLEKTQALEPKSLTLDFNKISCEHSKAHVGDGQGNYINRVHVVFKSDTPFQGLVIQANHAPFGLGFPFGQFDIHNEFSCSDCTHDFSRVIGCITRPDVSLMHPTVGVFHHKLNNKKKKSSDDDSTTAPTTLSTTTADPAAPITDPPPTESTLPPPPATDESKTKGDEEEVGPQTEVHFNFKWAHSPCSSARMVEFWVLLVLDFDWPVWVVKKFGPYEFQPPKLEPITIKDSAGTGPAFSKEIRQPFLPSPILPNCAPLPPLMSEYLDTKDSNTIPFIPGTVDIDGKPHALIELPLGKLPASCYLEYGIRYNATKCYRWKLHKYQAYMKSPKGKERMLSQIVCEKADPYFDKKLFPEFNRSTKWSPLRTAGSYDTECVQFYNRPKTPGMKVPFKQPHKVCPAWQAQFYCSGDTNDLKYNEPWEIGSGTYKTRLFPKSKCRPCEQPKATPAPPPDPKVGIFKLGLHGGSMMFAFFLFLPMSITISRFYKETMHTKELKGWRTWLVLHVIFAILVVFIAYISYTLPSFHDLSYHVTLGYASVFCCVGGLATGWVRQKDDFLRTIMFYIHGISGYAGWALGIASFVVAPGIQNLARYVAYGASAFSLLAMLILTVQICITDSDMEMHPKRPHIPIVAIRFDDIFPPGHGFRKYFLVIYGVLQLAICCLMLTVPWGEPKQEEGTV